jgi:hypothetical protein
MGSNGIRTKPLMFFLFKDIQDMDLKENHSNFNSNIILNNLILKFILHMEFLIPIHDYKIL